MNELQELNAEKDKATNAQIMFLVLNTSGLTIIPVSIIALRTAADSVSPTDIFLPILISTYIASLAGLIFVSIKQKINLLNSTVLLYLGALTGFIGLLLYYVISHPEQGETVSIIVGGGIMFMIILSFILMAMRKKVNVYESFIDGAKEGFNVAISIIPFLIAMLFAISLLRSTGALTDAVEGIKWAVINIGITATEWVDTLHVGIMKPLSGSGARGALAEIINEFGVDSMQGKIGATMQGSTETTLYVTAVYYGAVKIKKTRYTVAAGLFADLVGIIAAIFVSYIFFANG
jgi:spore maturation protein SpmB